PTDDVPAAPYGMAEAERLPLPDRHDLAGAGTRGFERFEALALLAQRCLKLERNIEIIDQSSLSAARDEDQFLDACLTRLVDRILNKRPVDDRHQPLGAPF